MDSMKVGIVGCGNIAADLCIALHKGDIAARIGALTDVNEANAQKLKATFLLDAPICPLDDNAAQVDFLVECAATDAVQDVLDAAMKYHRNCLILSVGGLMEHPEYIEQAREYRVDIRVPSGALCGLDGIRAAAEAGLHTVVLTTRKPPKGLEGAPYLVENDIDLDALTEATEVFAGSAREACKAFPKNVNVAAALSIVGIGPDDTQVRVVADPKLTDNVHEIVAEGAFGRLETRTVNLPSPRNAKSSYLASLSGVAELRAAAAAFAAQYQLQ